MIKNQSDKNDGPMIMVPKNSGLKKYTELALATIKNANASGIVEARGEDIPFWIDQLTQKGKNVVGLTGEDLYVEYCLGEKETRTKVIRKIEWDDPCALFRKPTLCLIGRKDGGIEKIQGKATVCIASKYKRIADRYLSENFEKRGLSIEKIYMNGSVESGCAEGIADFAIDIVYTGSSIDRLGLKICEKIMQSDFVIIGGK